MRMNRLALPVALAAVALVSVATLERRATPDDVRRAVSVLRAAGFDNLSLDLLYDIPDATETTWTRSLDAALALARLDADNGRLAARTEIAKRLGISQPAYAQQENSDRLRKSSREKIAGALGILPEQLDF